jgi:hypothetical protein
LLKTVDLWIRSLKVAFIDENVLASWLLLLQLGLIIPFFINPLSTIVRLSTFNELDFTHLLGHLVGNLRVPLLWLLSVRLKYVSTTIPMARCYFGSSVLLPQQLGSDLAFHYF